jgi:hypothetical protein
LDHAGVLIPRHATSPQNFGCRRTLFELGRVAATGLASFASLHHVSAAEIVTPA